MPTVHNRPADTQVLSGTRKFLTRLTLQARFLLIMGVSSLIITLLFWAMFSNFTEQLLERIGARFAVEQSMFDKAKSLSPLIQEMASSKQAAESPILGDWATNERDPDLYRRSMEELGQHFGNSNFYIAIAQSRHFYYYDAASRIRKQPISYTLNPSEPDDAWIFDFIQSGDNQTVKVLSNKKLGMIKLWTMMAIRKGGKVVGVLGTGINLYDFTRNATNIRLPGVTNMFVDRNADIQVYNDISHYDFPGVPNLSEPEHLHLKIWSPDAGHEWMHQSIARLDDGSSGLETEFVKINGKKYLAGMIALPELGWYDLTLLDMSVLLPQNDFKKIVIAVFAGTLGLLAILAFSLHKLVLKPVSTLAAAVSRIRQGDFSSNPREESSGEVRELIHQFRHMASTIQSTQQWLEGEIEKRTRQLIDAQKIMEITLHHERDGRETQANLMALMAHEMRSPIAVIGNTAQMLNMLAKDERPDWQPRIEKIMRSVRELATLMDTFLSEKWLDMDKHGLNRENGDLNVLCAETTASFIDTHLRPVHFEPCSLDASICADWQLIRIAVLNLLDNASKYSSQGDKIELKVLGNKTGMMCIEVSDHGMGIASELQPHIFDKFARGRHEVDIQGSGLGLYLVNWIARFHGGYTEVSSAKGQGSTFRLFLPKC